METIITIKDLRKVYKLGSEKVVALDNINLEIQKGQVCCILGNYVLNIALNIVFMGSIYAKMFAELDGTTESEEQVIGCVSGFLPIVAVFKFLCMK